MRLCTQKDERRKKVRKKACAQGCFVISLCLSTHGGLIRLSGLPAEVSQFDMQMRRESRSSFPIGFGKQAETRDFLIRCVLTAGLVRERFSQSAPANSENTKQIR